MVIELKHFSIDDFIEDADTSRAGPPNYANHIRFNVSENELIINFYQVIPSATGDPEKIDVSLVQRIVLPVASAKGFASGLVNLILNTQEAFQREFPNQREQNEADKVDLWEILTPSQQ